MGGLVTGRAESPTPRMLPAPAALLLHECRILRLSVIGIALALLGFISLILILGPPHQRQTAISFFEDLASLALLATTAYLLAPDQDQRTLEFVLLAASSPPRLYVRRFLLVLAINAGLLTGLAFVWRLTYLPLSLAYLVPVALPPLVFVASLSFALSLLTKNANIGAMLTGAYWLLHQLLRGHGDQGWFGYLFLFKATYYPASATFAANRCVLFLVAAGVLVVAALALRRVDRYL